MPFKDPDRQREYRRLYRERNRERIKAQARERYRLDPASQRDATTRWLAKNPTYHRDAQRRWREKNPERAREIARQSYHRDPSRARGKWLKYRYGITLEDYDAMLVAQGGGCALCQRFPNEGRRLAVDHDHETGRIRGLLCNPCNVMLGWYEARQDLIRGYLD